MPAETTRFTLNLPPRTAEVLEEMAREQGINKTDVIRNALATERYLRRRVKAGEQVYIRGRDGLERLVFPYWEELMSTAGSEGTELEAELQSTASDKPAPTTA